MSTTVDSADRNYASMFSNMSTPTSSGKITTENGVTIDTTGSSQSEMDLDVSDFLNLMVEQLTNQDFTNPVDDTQYLSQLAQFASMYQMTELGNYSKTTYVSSLIGKEVTVSSYTKGGDVELITGKVDKVSVLNNEYKIYIDGEPYELSQISTINEAADSSQTDEDGTASGVDTDSLNDAYKQGYLDAYNSLFGTDTDEASDVVADSENLVTDTIMSLADNSSSSNSNSSAASTVDEAMYKYFG